MTHQRIAGVQMKVLIGTGGLAAIAVSILLALAFHLDLPAAAFVILIVIVAAAVLGGFSTAAVLSIISVVALAYFFVEPRFTMQVASPDDIRTLSIFILASIVMSAIIRHIASLAERMRSQAQLLDLTHDAVIVRDNDDAILFWNRGAEELYGWSQEEAVGQILPNLLKTQFPAPLGDIRQELLSAGRWQGELVHTRRDGAQMTVASRWSVQRDASGAPKAVLETGTDITERRQAEERQRQSQDAFLEEAQRLSQTGSLAWNVATGEVVWSDETYRICGVSRSTQLTLDFLVERIQPDQRDGFRGAVQAAIKSRGRFDREIHFTRDDGEVRVLHMLGHFLADQPSQFVGAINDVTERRRDEQALRTSEFRYRNMFRAMAASFWELDFTGILPLLRNLKKQGVADYGAYFAANPDFVRELMRATRIIDVNDQTVVLFGRGDKSAILDASLDQFWSDAATKVYADSVLASLRRDPGFSAETRLRRIDGTEFEALFTVSFPAEGIVSSHFLVGVVDISERVSAQEALRVLQAEFAHAARLSTLGELAASIAHEVNQPLAAIATNASAGLRWLDRPQPNLEEVRALATRIAADARRAADIIARVRGMAMRRTTEKAPLQLAPIIEEAAAFLRHDLQAQRVSMQLSLAPNLPAVMGDRTQLQQVVVNLAMNGAQAMSQAGDGPRRLAIGVVREDDDLVVTVDDTGPGISPDHFDRLFQSFFTTKEGGMGIGLPICRSIVEAHGGRISAENRAGGGARFRFTLPISAAA